MSSVQLLLYRVGGRTAHTLQHARTPTPPTHLLTHTPTRTHSHTKYLEGDLNLLLLPGLLLLYRVGVAETALLRVVLGLLNHPLHRGNHLGAFPLKHPAAVLCIRCSFPITATTLFL